jgi:hypothetical protein
MVKISTIRRIACNVVLGYYVHLHPISCLPSFILLQAKLCTLGISFK